MTTNVSLCYSGDTFPKETPCAPQDHKDCVALSPGLGRHRHLLQSAAQANWPGPRPMDIRPVTAAKGAILPPTADSW